MVFTRDLDNVRNQVLNNPNILSMDELIDHLLRVTSSKRIVGIDSSTCLESLVFLSNSGGKGRDRGGSRGGHGNCPQCFYCKMGMPK